MQTEPRTALVVRNPRSRHAVSEHALWQAAEPLRRRGWRLEVRSTTAPGEATSIAARAAHEGVSTVVACGGDGTINEVVNGLAGADTALAVVPSGTANVWAREAFIPRDPAQAFELIPRARRVRADLGVANGRRFLLMCGIGLDAGVVRRVERMPAKRVFGRALYGVFGAAAVARGSSISAVLTVDGRPHERDLLQLVAGNTRLYGGVARITSAARIEDGLLDVCVLHGAATPGERFRLAARALRGGLDAQAARGVDYFRARQVEVATEVPAAVQVDGEYLGETPVTLRVEPKALTVLLAPRPNVLLGEYRR